MTFYMKRGIRTSIFSRHRYLIAGILCLFGICLLSAQDKKKKERVDLLYADEAQADKKQRPDVQVLVGSVKLRHDSMYMYCDSALIYEKTNSVEAFGNVRMEQGDTLFIYSDYLNYDGMTQLAMLRMNVRLINRNTELTTDSLNYDRVYNLGYYFTGGTLTDEENVLSSIWGEYSPATKLAVFNHEVELVNPKFTLTSDTLKYSTLTKVATILGPSDIVSDDNHIYSERGIYNTATEQAELLDRSILTNQGKKLVGDSLFMHGDTLRLITYHLNTDSMYREMRVYHKVRAYRTDVQAVCDSLVYNSKDSCMTMYTDPILWHGPQQLLGEQIKVYMNDSTIDWAHIINQALAIEQKDSIHYNQVGGREMKGYFVAGDMRRVEVDGNVQVIYYPIEERDSSLIGLNFAEAPFLRMHLKDRKLENGVFVGKTTGKFTPIDQIMPEQYRLSQFVWFDYIRPRTKEDIFEWRGKKAGDELQKSDRKPVVSPRNMNIKRTNKK